MEIKIDYTFIKEQIEEKKVKRAFVQIPEGLRKNISFLNDFLSSLGVEAIFDLEPCFGSCDLPVERAKIYGCDAIIHIGHLEMRKNRGEGKIKAIFVPVYLDFKKKEIKEFLEKNDEIFENLSKTVFIGYSLPYKKVFEFICDYLSKIKGIDVKTGENASTGEKGLVLGCDFSALKDSTEKNDAIIISGGTFHVIGALSSVKFRKLVNVDVDNLSVNIFGKREKENLEKRKLAKYLKFLESDRIGVLICDKKGQWQTDFRHAKKALESKGKKVLLLTCFTLKKEKTLGLDVDAILNLACPRIEEDEFEKPVISWKTLKYFLDKYGDR